MRADVIVIGGGPAGCMAAITAASAGARVVLAEKMPLIGRKLGISGKGRCNFTNVTDVGGLVASTPGNGPFLYSAFSAFGSEDTLAFISDLGLPWQVERGDRAFLRSGKATDLTRALERRLVQLGVALHTAEPVRALARDEAGWRAETRRDAVTAHAAIVATGGVSYPQTGSTGDGLAMAARLGHRIVEPRPSLVRLRATAPWLASVQGLSLRNVTVSALKGAFVLAQEQGELLFTHDGVSGPAVLTLSRRLLHAWGEQDLSLSIDLKPALEVEVLDRRLVREFCALQRKLFRNSLDGLLPAKLRPVIAALSGVPPNTPVHQVTATQRKALAALLKGLTLELLGPGPIAEAIVTAGGVDVREVDPRTMESRLVTGLFFAGEVLDVDALTGGFNLQAAWSTGHVAGLAAARRTLTGVPAEVRDT